MVFIRSVLRLRAPRPRLFAARYYTMSPVQFPPHFADTDHRQRCLAQLRSKSVSLEKYIYLDGLKGRDANLFYDILLGHMSVRRGPHKPRTKSSPPSLGNYSHPVHAYSKRASSVVVRRPIILSQVGEACVNYSHIWRRPEGLYVSIHDKGRIRDVLASWPNVHEARIAVVTDGKSPCSTVPGTSSPSPFEAPASSDSAISAPMGYQSVSENCASLCGSVASKRIPYPSGFQGSVYCGRGHQARLDRTSGCVRLSCPVVNAPFPGPHLSRSRNQYPALPRGPTLHWRASSQTDGSTGTSVHRDDRGVVSSDLSRWMNSWMSSCKPCQTYSQIYSSNSRTFRRTMHLGTSTGTDTNTACSMMTYVVLVASSLVSPLLMIRKDSRHGIGHFVRLHQCGASLLGCLGQTAIGSEDVVLWRGFCGDWCCKAVALVFHELGYNSRRGQVSHLRERDRLQ